MTAFRLILPFVLLLTISARAQSDDCDATFTAHDWGGASVACMYSYENFYKQAAHLKGERHDEALLLAANDLAFAGISNVRSGLNTEDGKAQLQTARSIVQKLLSSKYVADDARVTLGTIDRWLQE